MINIELINRWNNSDDYEVADFILMLRESEIRKSPLDAFDHKVLDEEGIDQAFKMRLQLVKQHKLFKMLLSAQGFESAYNWLDALKAPKLLKTAEGKIRFLESVVISFSLFARLHAGLSENISPLDRKQATKSVNKAAEQLIYVIRNRGVFMEPTLRKCCEASLSLLEFIAEYEAEKVRVDATFKEREFLRELIGWFRFHNIGRSPTPIADLMLLIIVDYQQDERNLIANIQSIETKIIEEEIQAKRLYQVLN